MSDTKWIAVGDLAEGFAPNSHILAQTDILNGQEYQLYVDDHLIETFKINDKQRVSTVREGIYFIDEFDMKKAHSQTLVLDLNTGCFTKIIGSMPKEKDVNIPIYQRAIANQDLTSVAVHIQFGTIGIKDNAPLHHEANELIGFRNEYTYSNTEKYEHIYLNQNYYTWHCLEGVEKGLCDTDRCHTIKITQDLYLFIWREKIIPTLGVVMIDMKHKKTDGKIFGYAANDLSQFSNFQIGAYIKVMNQTQY
jgi:hypothetical protein